MWPFGVGDGKPLGVVGRLVEHVELPLVAAVTQLVEYVTPHEELGLSCTGGLLEMLGIVDSSHLHAADQGIRLEAAIATLQRHRLGKRASGPIRNLGANGLAEFVDTCHVDILRVLVPPTPAATLVRWAFGE